MDELAVVKDMKFCRAGDLALLIEEGAVEGDVKGRAASAAAVEPDPTAVRFGDLLDDGESDSRARPPILPRAEALERLEYLFVMLEVDSTAGIAHGDVPDVSILDDRNRDARSLAGSHVIDRVTDQIRENLIEPGAGAVHERGVRRKLQLDPSDFETLLEFRL